MSVPALRLAIALLTILPAMAAPEPAQLTPNQVAQAIKTDTLTIPTPGELFAALAKPGKIDWPSQYPRSDADDLSKSRADCAQPRRLDC